MFDKSSLLPFDPQSINQSINQSSFHMFVFINLVDFLSPWEPVGRSLGSLGGPPGGPGRPKLLGPVMVERPRDTFKFRVDFCLLFFWFLVRFGGPLGLPFGSQDGLKSVQDRSRRLLKRHFDEKSDFSRNSTFYNAFCTFWTPRWSSRGPKIAPRGLQEDPSDDL